jgi:hypothetical protein
MKRAKEARFPMKEKIGSPKTLPQSKQKRERADDFDLFAKAFRTVLKHAMRICDTSGREGNAVYWELQYLEGLIKSWPRRTREQKELLARARNVGQMFVFSIETTGEFGSERRRMVREIERNPNWPNPPRRRRA